jgi:hypothetical protein
MVQVFAKVLFWMVLLGFLGVVFWWLGKRRRKRDRDGLVIYSDWVLPSPPPPTLDLNPRMYDLVNMLYDVPEYAECPYGDGNIRETFYEDTIVRCSDCGAFHHRSCFDRFGKCGSIRCRARFD